MAPDRRWAVLALAVLLAACGGSKKEAELEAAENARLAALRARTDSIRKAKAAADSLAQVAYTACSDSATAALKKTAAGRRALKQVAAGAVAAEVTTACGEPRFTAGTLAAKGDSAAASAQNAPGEATPAQQLARADSARRAQLAASTTPAPADSAAAVPAQAAAQSPQQDSDVLRETFAYGGGARDPFVSLINTKSAGPELVDLTLVAIYQDMRSSANSVAVLREKQSGKRHKLRTGDQIGRLRVAQIRAKDVVFTVEDFGFERQETLSLRKQEDVTQ